MYAKAASTHSRSLVRASRKLRRAWAQQATATIAQEGERDAVEVAVFARIVIKYDAQLSRRVGHHRFGNRLALIRVHQMCVGALRDHEIGLCCLLEILRIELWISRWISG